MPFGDMIRMEVPACEECLRVVRLSASGAASLCGFATEYMEDAIAAVHESALLLLKYAGPSARWIIEFQPAEAFSAKLTIQPCARPTASVPDLEVAEEVLLTLVDVVSFQQENSLLQSICLQKRP